MPWSTSAWRQFLKELTTPNSRPGPVFPVSSLISMKPSLATSPLAFADVQSSRRTFLTRTAHGVGKIALASLLNPALLSAALASPAKPAGKDKWTGAVNPSHYPPKAKRGIWLTMAGVPSQLGSVDYEP